MTSSNRAIWSLTVASAALTTIGAAAAIAVSRDASAQGDPSVWLAISFVVPIVAFSAVGGLIVSRRPGNTIGWLLAVIGLLFSFVIACGPVALWGLRSGQLSEGLAEWISVGGNAWVVALGLIGTQLLLRLPDGMLPSPLWRWYSRATVVLIAVALLGMATQKGLVMGVPGTENPLAAAWAAPLAGAIFLVIVSFVVSIVALVRRYRRSAEHDRVQLRWVAFTGVLFVAIFIVTLALGSVLGDSPAGIANTAFSQAAFAALPIGIGYAVLRERLYDIDVVINRALVYGALTAILGGTYLGSVLLLQLALRTFTEGSGLAVAASTLATAALFRPLRARTQAVVDRRFFRRKYDAAQTLQAFGARLRDQVDLESLTADLRNVVTDTVQPSHVTLWIRTSGIAP